MNGKVLHFSKMKCTCIDPLDNFDWGQHNKDRTS
jgi:hypothetical protein